MRNRNRGLIVFLVGLVLIVVCSWISAGPITSNYYAMDSPTYWSSAETAAMDSGEVPARVTVWYFLEYLVDAGKYVGAALIALGVYIAVKPEPSFPPPPPAAPVGICPKCGVKNLPTSKHCTECGTMLV